MNIWKEHNILLSTSSLHFRENGSRVGYFPQPYLVYRIAILQAAGHCLLSTGCVRAIIDPQNQFTRATYDMSQKVKLSNDQELTQLERRFRPKTKMGSSQSYKRTDDMVERIV